MGVMGQGLVLMVAGMTVVYLFLWLMIVVVKHSSRFVVKFGVSNKVALEGEVAEEFVRRAEEAERNRGCIDFSREHEVIGSLFSFVFIMMGTIAR